MGKLSGNKGEWSEIYTLFKLLADGKLYLGDADLKRYEAVYHPIIRILRQEELDRTLEFTPQDGDVKIVFIESGEEKAIPRIVFAEQAQRLLSEIKEISSSQALPETELFMSQIGCNKIKAPSSKKADIKIVIHDRKRGLAPTLEFSIKSRLGHSPTLLNASKSTNFIYQITPNISSANQDKINSLSDRNNKIRQRIQAIYEGGAELAYQGCESLCFQNNLMLIDSCMPQLLGHMLLLYYKRGVNRISDLANLLHSENPLGYNTDHHRYYDYKIKKLLVEIALGLMPASVWTGLYDATGGYIVVREDGEIVSYHIYDRNAFEDYLFHNTKLDTPSTARHNFGSVSEGLFKLNLQIRFL